MKGYREELERLWFENFCLFCFGFSFAVLLFFEMKI